MQNLEKYLLDRNEWETEYNKMPLACKKAVALGEYSGLDIGWKEELGWFVVGGSIGLYLMWSEKGDNNGL